MKIYEDILFIIYGKNKEIEFYRNIGRYLLQNNIHYKLIVIDLFDCKNNNDIESFFKKYDDISDQLFDKNFKKEFYYFYQDRFINDVSYQTCYGKYKATYEEMIKAFIKISNFAYNILKKYPNYVIYSESSDNYFINIFRGVAEFLKRKYFWLDNNYCYNDYIFFSDKECTNDIFKGKVKSVDHLELNKLKNKVCRSIKKIIINNKIYSNNLFSVEKIKKKLSKKYKIYIRNKKLIDLEVEIKSNLWKFKFIKKYFNPNLAEIILSSRSEN
jgi:hypothetical protein